MDEICGGGRGEGGSLKQQLSVGDVLHGGSLGQMVRTPQRGGGGTGVGVFVHSEYSLPWRSNTRGCCCFYVNTTWFLFFLVVGSQSERCRRRNRLTTSCCRPKHTQARLTAWDICLLATPPPPPPLRSSGPPVGGRATPHRPQGGARRPPVNWRQAPRSKPGLGCRS